VALSQVVVHLRSSSIPKIGDGFRQVADGRRGGSYVREVTFLARPEPISAAGRLAVCPSCGHEDVVARPLVAVLLARLREPRTCCYAIGDEISPLRSELCGCDDPVHRDRVR
jgi:hypothetical protein